MRLLLEAMPLHWMTYLDHLVALLFFPNSDGAAGRRRIHGPQGCGRVVSGVSFRWFLGHVSVVSLSCFGCVLVMFCWCLG